MQTLFVTGAEGFAGTHLVAHLRQRGYDVVAGVRNRARKLAIERQHGKALVCDVADAINVARCIASVRPDGVVHLAGTAQSAEAAAEPLTAYQSVVNSWANVLDAVRRAVPRARVLLVSGCEVYGNAGSDGRPLAECTPAQPVTMFGALKTAAESIAHAFHTSYHLDLSIARPFYSLGPGQPESSFFGALARRLAAWDPIVHGGELRLPDLDCRRDVLHVQDLVEAYERLLIEGKPDQVYNVCSGTAHTLRELAGQLAAGFGLSLELVEAKSGDGQGTLPVLCGDPGRIARELGWRPARALADAVRDVVTWLSRKPATAGR